MLSLKSDLPTMHLAEPCLLSGQGGEAGRHGAGGPGHGAVSQRPGAGASPRAVPVSAAPSPQSAADLNSARAASTQRPGSYVRRRTSQTRKYFGSQAAESSLR